MGVTRLEFIKGALVSLGFGAFGGRRLFAAPLGWKHGGTPNLVFGVLSDTHLRTGVKSENLGANWPDKYFVAALEYFKECNCLINKKVKAVLANGMKPILCVGEKLEEREAGNTIAVVSKQTSEGMAGLSAGDAQKVVIAYEPVWAIGTGKTATPAMAQEVHAEIRKVLADLFGAEASENIQILYGGSMKPENADDLLKEKDIDGGLIGGAALKADSFVALVKSAAKLA